MESFVLRVEDNSQLAMEDNGARNKAKSVGVGT